MSEDVVQAQQAVEAILAHRIVNEDGFAERLEADPKAVVAPIIAEVLEDDGDLDFSSTDIVVHAQDDSTLHFVVPAAPADVSGFSFGRTFGMDRLVMAPIFHASSDGTTHTDKCVSKGGEDDAKCQPSTLFMSPTKF